jgi:hypothetical protein
MIIYSVWRLQGGVRTVRAEEWRRERLDKQHTLKRDTHNTIQ